MNVRDAEAIEFGTQIIYADQKYIRFVSPAQRVCAKQQRTCQEKVSHREYCTLNSERWPSKAVEGLKQEAEAEFCWMDEHETASTQPRAHARGYVCANHHAPSGSVLLKTSTQHLVKTKIAMTLLRSYFRETQSNARFVNRPNRLAAGSRRL